MKTLTKRQNFTFCSAIFAAPIFASLLMLSPLAHAQNESGVNPLEMEQLQAQVDVMLEEMSELQGYRICGEQGFVFDPNSADADADGYGDPNLPQAACTAPSGTVGNGADCDDSDGSVNPDALETCNGADDNCSGEIDEGASLTSR